MMTEKNTADTRAGGSQEYDSNASAREKIRKDNIESAFDETSAYYCLECGKCTGICPVALADTGFSPRLVVKRALLGYEEELCSDRALWECLTCGLCRNMCRSDVNLPDFIRILRLESRKIKNLFQCSHNDVFNIVPKLQIKNGEKQNRLGWLTPDIKTKDKGEVLFFVGCAPYHQIMFKEHGKSYLDLPLASIKLLNAAGIEPVLLTSERCCGHDQYWTADTDSFERLLQLNVKDFKEAGVKKIITACPECYYMFNQVYPKFSEDWKFESIHITELMAEKIESGQLVIPEGEGEEHNETVSYHDPCKLGRFSGIYDAPRKIIRALPGVKLSELAHSKSGSRCCGVNSFINCNMTSREWRSAKLKEAVEAGSGRLITSCPKCSIHLNCYTVNKHVEPKYDIKIDSLIIMLAEALGLMPEKNDV